MATRFVPGQRANPARLCMDARICAWLRVRMAPCAWLSMVARPVHGQRRIHAQIVYRCFVPDLHGLCKMASYG
eukprot:1159500-Pelagomonas_calceolata.AAC.15